MYSVLVTEVRMQLMFACKPTPAWRKAVAYNLTGTIAWLHEAGIVHGELAEQDPDPIMDYFGRTTSPSCCPSPPPSRHVTIPAYLLAPWQLVQYNAKISKSEIINTDVRKYDCGTAGTLPLQMVIDAPETLFAFQAQNIANPPVETHADVWSLGAVILKLFSCSSPSHAGGSGKCPSSLVTTVSHKRSGFEEPWPRGPITASEWWCIQGAMIHECSKGYTNKKLLMSLLERISASDPAKGPTATEILLDPWFADVSKDA
ncbi:hypothetical protein DXG01_017096 [Tephrocybe rancida]|nr:hypothetical protein DXG01_017096 [Tephrocybe rancida]